MYRRGRYTRDKLRIRCTEFPCTATVKSLICLSAAGTSTFLRLARLILFRNRSLSESGAGGGSLPGPDGFCLRGKGTGTPLPPVWFPLWDLELRGRRLGPLKPGLVRGFDFGFGRERLGFWLTSHKENIVSPYSVFKELVKLYTHSQIFNRNLQ